MDCDLEADSGSSKLKCRRIEFGQAHVTVGVVGSSYALAKDPQQVRIQLAVGILVVKHRYGNTFPVQLQEIRRMLFYPRSTKSDAE